MTRDELDFDSVYDAFQPMVRRYLARVVGEHEADDLAQEVFLNVSRGLDAFRGESRLSTWIYRIATNAAMDRLRSASFRRAASERPLLDAAEGSKVGGGDEREPADASAPSPEQRLVRKEMNECIRGHVGQLPESYRTAIVLSEMEGLSNRDIADILGVSVDTVKIRLHRGRAKLKDGLRTGCDFYYDEQNELACEPKENRPGA